MKNIKELRIGDKYSTETLVTEEMINGFAHCTGDNNPVHLDEQFASNSIFKKRIAHGFLIGSFISALLGNEFPGIGTIYLSQFMKFIKPVFIDDKITIIVEIISINEKNWIELNTLCTNQQGMDVIVGTAWVIPPQNIKIIK